MCYVLNVTHAVSEEHISYFNFSATVKIMSSTAQLNRIIKECYNTHDLVRTFDTFNQYQQSQCYYPREQRVFDSHTQEYRTIEIACGKCYHCQQTKINSWVTRMYAHLEDFKHVYFITLTYTSFYKVNPVADLIIKKLSQAVWHWDNMNSYKRYCYRPCLLIKKHYQDFIKRLRKNTGISDISYVLTGEYGHQYGSPHFHAVLFSNSPITENDIKRAWSIALWRSDSGEWSYRTNQKNHGQAYNFQIGRIDYNDLVTNGTLNTTRKIRVDDRYLDSSNCFAYVCKYVCKVDYANYSRVRLAYRNLFHEELFVNDPELGVVPFHVSFARCKSLGFDELYINKLKQNSYYESIPFPSLEILGEINYFSRIDAYGCYFIKPYYPESIIQFLHSFAPFVEFSRGCPIGSLYTKTHIQEFVQGIYNKPLLQDHGFIVPNYFRRKAQEYVYGLRFMHKTICGVSFNKTGLLDLYRHLESVDLGESDFRYCVPACLSSTPYEQLLRDPRFSVTDLNESARVLFVAGRAMSFRFNRHTRKYDRIHQMPVSDWIREQCHRLHNDFKNYRTAMRENEQHKKERAAAFTLIEQITQQDIPTIRGRFIANQDAYLKRRQDEYYHLKIDFA